ncbi:SHOCT domain-containing protein [Protaetiibacter intestinalis]|uniref:Uncharacterized protein n=1 Tax=Protaetiibacter intestinalis TaxID=2419774 RepID=A0A387B839_9MICO|nr:hypothetical protein [Protaetiibacter intestinalis]AYF97149.1 hypothetical protein D7I47_02080 [Protaetiibacter intestinalis]
MPTDDPLYPPVQYGGGWLLLVFAILLALVVAGFLVARLTRPRRLPPHPQGEQPTVIAQLRGEYLTAIDEVGARFAAGEIDARRAHGELSRLMRGFVNEYSGLEAPVLTLHDLVEAGVHPSLVDALSRFSYPSLFRRQPPVDPALGLEAARQVVRSWR